MQRSSGIFRQVIFYLSYIFSILLLFLIALKIIYHIALNFKLTEVMVKAFLIPFLNGKLCSVFVNISYTTHISGEHVTMKWLNITHQKTTTCDWFKPGIHVATDCNMASRDSQLQRVLGSVAVRYLTLLDIFLRQPIALQIVAWCMLGNCASSRTHESVFYIIYFWPVRASHTWDLICDRALQSVATCMLGLGIQL